MADAYIHPKAIVETPDIGPDTRVWAFAHVMPDARVGAGCNICDHTYIEGGVVVGDRVTVKSGVYLWEGMVVEDAVVTKDVEPDTVVVGNLARVVRRLEPSHP